MRWTGPAIFLAVLLTLPALGGISNGPASSSEPPPIPGALTGFSITVDAGHGGSASGTTGSNTTDGVNEKDINLAISLQVRDLLEADGATVVMTRTTDVDVSLASRVSIANIANTDIFVSIHANSAGFAASGIESFYWEKYDHTVFSINGQALCQAINDQEVARSGANDRGIKKDHSYLGFNLYVLNNTAMPACLTETGFMSNPAEEILLKEPWYRNQLAVAIYEGIAAYFGQAAQGNLDAEVTGYAVPAAMGSGSTDSAWVRWRNTGLEAWLPGTVMGAFSPAWRSSPFVEAGWDNASSVATLGVPVMPGEEWNVSFTLQAPVVPDQWYNESFRLWTPAFTGNAWIGNSSVDAIHVTAPGPPVVIITAPADNATVSGNLTVSADVSDPDGIGWVRMRIDGGTWQWDSIPPHVWWVNTTLLVDGPHLVEVQANDSGDLRTTESITIQVSNIDHHLQVLATGWNLIGTPLVPESSDRAGFFSSIDGLYDLIWTWDSQWYSWDANRPDFMNDVWTIGNGSAMWVRVPSGTPTLDISGAADAIAVVLGPGWNLVGYPSMTNRSVTDAMSGVVYQELQTQGTPGVVDLVGLGGGDQMTAGMGYWIRVGSSQVWLPGA